MTQPPTAATLSGRSDLGLSKERANFGTLFELPHEARDSDFKFKIVGIDSLMGIVLLETIVEVLLRPSIEYPSLVRRDVPSRENTCAFFIMRRKDVQNRIRERSLANSSWVVRSPILDFLILSG